MNGPEANQAAGDSDRGSEAVARAQVERYRREALKFQEERRHLRFQREELKRRLSRRWYQRDGMVQAAVAGALGLPLLLTLFNGIIKPMNERDNIQLSLLNQRQERELQQRAGALDSLAAQLQESEKDRDSATTLLERAWDMVAERERELEEVTRILAGFTASAGGTSPAVQASVPAAVQQTLRPSTRLVAYRRGQLGIQDHRLVGPNVTFVASPNHGASFQVGLPDAIVFHYSAGRSLDSHVRWMQTPAAQASMHVVIGRDGRVVQLVPFDVTAFHAGASSYGGRSGYNRYSIGIDFDNAGQVTGSGSAFRSWWGGTVPASEVLEVARSSDATPSFWHVFTPVQIQIATEIGALLVREYGIREILGHEDVSPGRKADPGPAFPLTQVRDSIMILGAG